MAIPNTSDYGDIFLDLCDGNLRNNVVASLLTARAQKTILDEQHLNEIAAYINRLEDALVRHHAGVLNTTDVLEHLKRCTGLDVTGLAFSVDSMHAEDA